ncbi:peptidoglycan editing factor PgeF [Thermocaproicibacter melissae]|uniref:peptidoglycan editing factor PgeF n=1 Tax=Thermocaproicibacter melissae TaxID=2966552 RepID=UPI0024B0C4B1|nr:peptidoglycan editing factor PgeF [Thermocaproicibacter melissae]WBY63535.1 peptidoglycan editing factor PgeF [Thermocaproicibacter melissae]
MQFDAKNMELHNSGGVQYLTFPSFSTYSFVRHAFSTRAGGVSQNEFSSMNLGFGRGDSDENVLENYRRFCNAVGFNFNSLVSSAQDHHTNIRRVGKEHCGIGIWKPKDMQSVDGLITNEPGVTLVTHYADCVPIFLLDPVKHAVGLAHAGWRGTVARIASAAVEAMTREFGSRPQDMLAGIGPSIGPCCFEVDAPVRDAFAQLTDLNPQELIHDDGNGKFHIDLWETNRRILMRAGLKASSITVAEICTKCNSNLLFSHRATGGKRGGLAAFLALTEEAEA